MAQTFFSLLHSDLLKEVDKHLLNYSFTWAPYYATYEVESEYTARKLHCTLAIDIPVLLSKEGKLHFSHQKVVLFFCFPITSYNGIWPDFMLTEYGEPYASANSFIEDLARLLKSPCRRFEKSGMLSFTFSRFAESNEFVITTSNEHKTKGMRIVLPLNVGDDIIRSLIHYIEEWDKEMSRVFPLD